MSEAPSMMVSMTLLEWVTSNGLGFLGDVIIPVAAILVPTMIAVRIARRERLDAAEADRQSRRLEAGAGVIVSLSSFVSVSPLRTDMQSQLAALRGQIAVYRAWAAPGDSSGDWLAIKHSEGMHLWLVALEQINRLGALVVTDEMVEASGALHSPRIWAQSTIETFSGGSAVTMGTRFCARMVRRPWSV